MSYIRILWVFILVLTIVGTTRADPNKCIAQPCHCDGTCGDECTPFKLEADIEVSSTFELASLRDEVEAVAGARQALATTSKFEIQDWQLDETFDPKRLDEYAAAIPPGLADYASALEGVTTEDLSVALFSRPVVDGAPEGLSIVLEEFDPQRSLPIFDNLAIEGADFIFLPGHLPDVRPTDPGMGGGQTPGDVLSDVVKQTDPDDIRRCQVSVDQVANDPPNLCRQIVSRLCEGGCSNDDLSKRLKDPVRARVLKGLLATYDNQCLDRFDRTDNVDKSEFDRDYMSARSGALFINPVGASPLCKGRLSLAQQKGDPFVFCSAGVLDDDQLISARHCLRTNQRDKIGSYCLASGAVEFRSFADPDTAYKVAPLTPEEAEDLRQEKRVSEDFVFLRTQTPIAGVTSETTMAKPGAYAPAMIMGYHDLVTNSYKPNPGSWLGQVRWSRPYCSFIRSSGSCGVTKCQTIGGYSGVPVWSVDDAGATKLSGIQIDGNSASFAACLDFSHAQSLRTPGNLSISTFIQE